MTISVDSVILGGKITNLQTRQAGENTSLEFQVLVVNKYKDNETECLIPVRIPRATWHLKAMSDGQLIDGTEVLIEGHLDVYRDKMTVRPVNIEILNRKNKRN